LTLQNDFADLAYNHKSAYYFNPKMRRLLLINSVYIYLLLTLQTFFLKATPKENKDMKKYKGRSDFLSLQSKIGLRITKFTKNESQKSLMIVCKGND
jgi:hypothetical protein